MWKQNAGKGLGRARNETGQVQVSLVSVRDSRRVTYNVEGLEAIGLVVEEPILQV